MIETNVMQITDTATARVQDTLHLSLAGLPVEVSLYPDGPATGQLGNRFCWFCRFHADVKVVPKLQVAALSNLNKYHPITFQNYAL
jgi:hypothetical protein